MAKRKLGSSVTAVRRGSLPVQPTFCNTWPLWIWLGVTAALWYFARPALLVIAAVVGWSAFAARYPRTASAIMASCAASSLAAADRVTLPAMSRVNTSGCKPVRCTKCGADNQSIIFKPGAVLDRAVVVGSR
jgi:hypothetical protein